MKNTTETSPETIVGHSIIETAIGDIRRQRDDTRSKMRLELVRALLTEEVDDHDASIKKDDGAKECGPTALLTDEELAAKTATIIDMHSSTTIVLFHLRQTIGRRLLNDPDKVDVLSDVYDRTSQELRVQG